MEFFKGVSPWILSNNRFFFLFAFFTEILSEKNVFDILERKE